jgi:hypothetical protein
LPPLHSPISADVSDDDETSQASTSASTPADTPQLKRQSLPYKVNKKSRQDVSESSPTHNLFSAYIEKKYNTQKTTDTVIDFFVNLGETVKTFPEDVQIRVKREVFRIVSHAEEEVYLSKKSTEMKTNVHHIEHVQLTPSQSCAPQINSSHAFESVRYVSPSTQCSQLAQLEIPTPHINLRTEIETATQIGDVYIQDSVGEFLTFPRPNRNQH